ncbi:MAG: hypothetical protein ACKVIN_03655 [Longimicrobiales bacterium]|jgi:hypothetical protein
MSPVALPTLLARGASWNRANQLGRAHLVRAGWTDSDDPAPQAALLDDATKSIRASYAS